MQGTHIFRHADHLRSWVKGRSATGRCKLNTCFAIQRHVPDLASCVRTLPPFCPPGPAMNGLGNLQADSAALRRGRVSCVPDLHEPHSVELPNRGCLSWIQHLSADECLEGCFFSKAAIAADTSSFSPRFPSRTRGRGQGRGRGRGRVAIWTDIPWGVALHQRGLRKRHLPGLPSHSKRVSSRMGRTCISSGSPRGRTPGGTKVKYRDKPPG